MAVSVHQVYLVYVFYRYTVPSDQVYSVHRTFTYYSAPRAGEGQAMISCAYTAVLIFCSVFSVTNS